MVKNIENLSLPELKAYAYDLIVSREQATNMLQVVNQQIVKKLNMPNTDEKKKPKEKSK